MRVHPRNINARLVAGLVLGAAGLVSAGPGCDGRASDSQPPVAQGREAAQQAVAASVAMRVVMPALKAFLTAAQGLEAATDDYAQAVEQGTADDERAAAIAAFGSAMDTWQVLEQLQFGPTGSEDMVMGGQGFRDQIYSWPEATNPCRVDQELVAGDYDGDGFFDQKQVNVYGLDALEYLLFEEGTDNACAPNIRINQQGEWDGAFEANPGALTIARARYARAVASRVAVEAEALHDAWHPGGDGFVSELAQPGEGAVYGGTRDVLDALNFALFYLDTRVKDAKLALPAGISAACASMTCPEERESRFASRSKDNILVNLKTFRTLFLGGPKGDDEAFGFDDLLEEVGADALADRMREDIDAAVGAVEAIDGSLVDALDDDLAAVEAAHSAVKEITDALKSEFVTVLALRVPKEGAGDND